MDLPIYVRLQASNICEEPGYRSVLAKSKGPLCQKILAESPWDKRLSGLSAVSLATKSCIKAARHNLEPCYKSQAENKRRHMKQQRVWNNQIVVFTASQLNSKTSCSCGPNPIAPFDGGSSSIERLDMAKGCETKCTSSDICFVQRSINLLPGEFVFSK